MNFRDSISLASEISRSRRDKKRPNCVPPIVSVLQQSLRNVSNLISALDISFRIAQFDAFPTIIPLVPRRKNDKSSFRAGRRRREARAVGSNSRRDWPVVSAPANRRRRSSVDPEPLRNCGQSWPRRDYSSVRVRVVPCFSRSLPVGSESLASETIANVFRAASDVRRTMRASPVAGWRTPSVAKISCSRNRSRAPRPAILHPLRRREGAAGARSLPGMYTRVIRDRVRSRSRVTSSYSGPRVFG